MSPRSSSTIDPLVPLSLLEAVRDADRPDGAAEAEYVPELLNKRLGTTDTVYTQIRRYTEAVRRGRAADGEEVAALARLIARRPDALQLFRDAGRDAARTAYSRMASLKRAIIRFLPRFIAHPYARRQARKIFARYFHVALRVNGADLSIDVPRLAPLSAASAEMSREYYDAAMQELLSLLTLTSQAQ